MVRWEISRRPRLSRAAMQLLLAVAALVGGRIDVVGQAPPGAGRIAGTVLDAEKATPVGAARVRLIERHLETLSHADGTFAFVELPAGTYTLITDQLGYDQHTQQVTVAAGSTLSVRVELHPGAVLLDEILVTGSITRRGQREVLAPVSVVGGAELDRNMASTVAGTLERQPGIAVTGIGPVTARPVIRGLGGDRILMLEDGVRPGDMSSTSADHAVAVDPATAQQIEVVRGPMSLLYGSSALGGVVNVVRGEIPGSRPDAAGGNLSLQGESVSQSLSAAGFATFPAGPLSLRAEANARTSDDVETPLGPLVNTGARGLGFALGATHLPSWGHLGASYRLYDNHYGIPGGFVGGHERGVDIEMRRHTARVESELHRAQGRFFSTVHGSGSFSHYHHTELEASGAVGTEFFQDLAALELLARHDERGLLSQGAAGARAQYRDIQTGGSLRTPSTWDYTFALFGVEELRSGRLRVQVGARYDWARYEPRDTTAIIFVGGERVRVRPRGFGSLSGSAGVLFDATEAVQLGVSAARAYRTPDFNELYSNGPHLAANSFDVGDPSLESETGLGVDAFVRVGAEGLRAELAAFRNQLGNYIFPSSRGRAELGTQGLRPRFQYTNEDAVFTGAEGDVEWSPIRNVVVQATASYVRARCTSARAPIPIIDGLDTTFVAASEYPPLIPPLNGNVGVRWEEPRFFAGAGVHWAARQERLGDFETATDSYGVTRLDGGIRILRGERLHTLTLAVENLTDAEYRDHLSRIKDIMPQPGRSVSLLYRLSF
jgi:iron complex outermembrane receptor protein